MLSITRIFLQGFRGANKPLEITVSESLVISGPTGSGKTTLLQAIEWGLYGKIFGFTGPGFTNEDAYVNLFTDERQAVVTLYFILKDGKEVILHRERKEASKSTIGKTEVKLTINGSSFTDIEAQKQIEKLIGVDHEKFVQALFLHQETIRRFVEGKPTDRSAIIDQLLGTSQIRDFTESLDPKRKISGEIKTLQTIKERLEGEETRIEVVNQEQLDKQRDKLLTQGYKEIDLTLASLYEKIHQLYNEITKLAETYEGKSLLILEKFKTTEDTTTAIENVDSKLRELDRLRGDYITKYTEGIVRIKGLLKQYKDVVYPLSKEKKSQKDIEVEISKVENKQSDLEKNKIQLRDQANNLEPHVNEYQRLFQLIEKQEEVLQNFVKKYGDFKALQKKKEIYVKEIKDIAKELKQASSLAQILTSAHLYISKIKPTSCPVCEQNIKPKEILSHLKDESEKHGNQLQKKQAKANSLETENQKLDSIISEYNTISADLESLQKTANEELEQIRKILERDDIAAEDGASSVEKNRKLVEDLEEKITKLKDKTVQLNQKKDKLKQLEDALLKLEPNLQDELSVKLIKLELIAATENYIKEQKSKIKLLEDTQPIDTQRKKLEPLKKILDYVRNVETFENRQNEKSLLVQHVDFIDKQIEDLKDLEASLLTLRNILSEHQSSLTMQTLKEFQISIEKYYNKVLGHPYFQKIKIEPLSTEPITYDIIASDEEEVVKSHINTRYSTAQINATALAIFFAVNQKLAEKFPLIILDDPTQNMDYAHKEALAKTLADLAKKRQLLIATHDEQFILLITSYIKNEDNHLVMGQWTTDGPKPTN